MFEPELALPLEILSHILSFVDDSYTYFSIVLCSGLTYQLTRRLGLDRPAALDAFIEAAQKRDIELIQKLHLCPLFPDQETLAEITANSAYLGYIDVLDLLKDKNILVKEQVLYRGQPECITWFRQHFPRNTLLALDPICLAAKEGKLDRVQTLATTYPCLLRKPHLVSVVDASSEGGSLSVAQWLHSIVQGQFPFHSAIQSAAKHNAVNVLDWLYLLCKSPRSWENASKVAYNHQCGSSLQWLAQYFQPELAHEPGMYGIGSGVLLQLHQTGQVSDSVLLEKGISAAVRFSDLDLLKYLHQRTPFTLSKVQEIWHMFNREHNYLHRRRKCRLTLEIVKWLYSLYHILELVYSLKCDSCQHQITPWVLRYARLPSSIDADKSDELFRFLYRHREDYIDFEIVKCRLLGAVRHQLSVLRVCSVAAEFQDEELVSSQLPRLEVGQNVPNGAQIAQNVDLLQSPFAVSWLLKHGFTASAMLQFIQGSGTQNLHILETVQRVLNLAWADIEPCFNRIRNNTILTPRHFMVPPNYVKSLQSLVTQLQLPSDILSEVQHRCIIIHIVYKGNLSGLKWYHSWTPIPLTLINHVMEAAATDEQYHVVHWILQQFPTQSKPPLKRQWNDSSTTMSQKRQRFHQNWDIATQSIY